MAKYDLVIKRKALKELERIQQPAKEKILQKIELLANEPLPDGVKKLEGEDDLFRIRQGDYRAVFAINFKDHKVTVLTVSIGVTFINECRI